MSFDDATARLHLAASRIKYLFIRRPDTDTANPYLNARRTWNLHVGTVVYSRFMWQMMGLLGMLIGLAGVGGMIHIGSLSKFVPYVYALDRANQAEALGPAQAVSPTDPLVVKAEVRRFFEDARLVTPDTSLQRKAVDRVYARMASKDAAAARMNAWFQQNPPFQRAERIVVSTRSMTALPLTGQTMQVEWQEDIHDRKGALTGSVTMRATATYRIVETSPETSQEELDLNPARVFISDFSWTEIN